MSGPILVADGVRKVYRSGGTDRCEQGCGNCAEQQWPTIAASRIRPAVALRMTD